MKRNHSIIQNANIEFLQHLIQRKLNNYFNNPKTNDFLCGKICTSILIPLSAYHINQNHLRKLGKTPF